MIFYTSNYKNKLYILFVDRVFFSLYYSCIVLDLIAEGQLCFCVSLV